MKIELITKFSKDEGTVEDCNEFNELELGKMAKLIKELENE